MIELLLQAESALSFGMLERAETLYRQVSTADPRNAIAVVGLARVALERGDQPEALSEARRALGIDPENGAAQRMIERLEEVLAYRGQPAPTPAPPETDPPTTHLPPSDEAPALPATRSWIDRIVRRKN